MAEKLCELRKKGGGGGKYTETSLWTNPSPSSNFGGDDVTISQSLDNFKYIKVKFRFNASIDSTYSEIYPVEDFKTFTNTGSVARGCGHVGMLTSSATRYSRAFTYVDNLTINFKVAYQEGTATLDNSRCIPLEILGLNELAQGKTNQTILWTNPSPTSQFAAQTISLDLSEYDAIILKCSSINTNTLPSVYPTNICAQQYIPIPYGTAGVSMYRISYGLGYVGSESFNSNRETVVTTSGVTFGGGYRNYSAGNQYAIPIQIIGVKIS